MKDDLFLKFDAPLDMVNFRAGAGEDSVDIHADEHDPEEDIKATFTIRAYNGGAMSVGGFMTPVVLDLAGMKVTAKSRPILLNHNPETPIGHSTEVSIGARNVVVKGEFSVQNERTQEIINSAKAGFPWQASVGANVQALEFVDDGEKATANGRTFKGPVLIARKSQLQETSLVPLGADDSTSVKIAAQSAEGMEFFMKFEEWLKANGHVRAELSEDTLKALRATFDNFIKAEAEKEEAEKLEAEKKKLEAANKPAPVTPAPVQAGVDFEKAIKEFETRMLNANQIATVCAKHPKIHEQAVREQWSLERVQDKVELATIRAERDTNNFFVNTGAGQSGAVADDVIKAAAMQAGGLKSDDIVKEHGEKALEAAEKNYKGNIGLQQMFEIAARSAGLQNASMRNNYKETFYAAMRPQLQASFSTLSLPGILSNVANKFFVDNFNFVESTWRQVSKVDRVTDFKQISRFSLNGDMNFELLPPGSEISHATTGETQYNNQADTYAKMYSITRTDIINDDLGALTRVPAKLGRGAATNFNIIFWTEFLENALPFFSTGRGNLLTGATSVLGVDSLTLAVERFRTQIDPDDNPYGASPAILLTPPATEVTGRQLRNDTQILIDSFTAGDDIKITNGNPHAGLYTPVVSSYLQNANIPGSSSTLWFLLSNPEMSAQSVIETVFLNGQETPTVESADADFNTLGVQMRGFWDFGINKQEFREGVKSDGA